MLEVAGQDGTDGFEDVGHSEDARNMLTEYKIGELPEAEKEAAKAKAAQRTESSGGGWMHCSSSGETPSSSLSMMLTLSTSESSEVRSISGGAVGSVGG